MGLMDFFFKKDNKKNNQEVKQAEQPTENVNRANGEQATSYQKSIGSSSSEQPVKSPSSFEDVEMIIADLKCGNSVLVNVSNVDFAMGQRFVDVLSGAIVALNGLVTPIQKGLFYFSVKR